MMLKDLLYHVFVYPLESLLGVVLSLFYELCGSYGFSIILLSLTINVFLLKLFFIADRASKNHALIKSRLDKKIAEFKQVFNGGELYVYIKTLYRQNDYHPIYALKTLGGLALQAPFFIAVVSLLEFHSPELKGIKFGIIPDLLSPDGLLWGINLLPLLMTFFTLCNVWVTSRERGARIQGGIIAFVFLVLLYKVPSALLLYWTTSMAFALIKSVCVKYIYSNRKEEKPSQEKQRSFIGKIFNACFTKYSDLSPHDYKFYRNISIFAILNLCTLIFLYNPFALYASDVDQFNPQETWNTLGTLFGFFLLTSSFFVYSLVFFLKTRWLKLLTYGFSTIFTIAMIYSFVLDWNIFEGKPYPSMDGLLFISPINTPYMARYVDLLVCSLLMFVVFLMLVFFRNIVGLIMRISLIFLFLLGGYFLIDIVLEKEGKPKVSKNNHQEKILLKPKTNILNFSQNKKNVLLIISDTIQSDIFAQAIIKNPDFKNKLDGFVYYPNLLSVSSITYLSVPSILGGAYYHPIEIWKRIKQNGGTYKQEALNSLKNLLVGAAKQGYQVSVFAGYPADPIDVRQIGDHNIEITDQSFEEYLYQKNMRNRDGKIDNRGCVGDLFSFGLFKIAPYTIRNKIYIGDAWLFGSSLYTSHLFLSTRNTSFLDGMGEFLGNNNGANTLKIIHENSNHFPWMMDSSNKKGFISSDVEYMKIFLTNKNQLVYNNHISYLLKLFSLFEWMKKNHVYDNTKIIIVSDHGVRGYKIQTDDVYNLQTQPSHALLLIKDFQKRSELSYSNDFVSNDQAFYELCKIFGNTLEKCSYGYKNQGYKKFVFSNKIDFDSFVFDNIFEVKDSVFNAQNWKDITKEFLDNPNKKEEK